MTICRAAAGGVLLLAAWHGGGAAQARDDLRCAPFTTDQIAGAEPREAQWAHRRFDRITAELTTVPHRVLFFGDSLTEWFELRAAAVWDREMTPRGVLDAGVSGDRTEHLLWRLQHGHLDGPAPAGIVVLIGTNDVTKDRPADIVAEGVRRNLLYLRQRLPAARILLLGLWPREASPEAPQRRATVAVNQQIRKCDGGAVTYADIGRRLLEPDGRLSPAISADQLHVNEAGYQRLFPEFGNLIDRIAPRR